MLLRDSYPLKVEDIPVIDCPSGFSKVYLGVYPFLSSHFLSKLIRITPHQLRQHFAAELLSERLQGTKKKKKKETSSIHNRKKKQYSAIIMNATTTSSNGRNSNDNNNNDENDWENLNDSSSSIDNDTTTTSTENKNKEENTSNSNNDNDNDSNDVVWTTIERLARMRFETESQFRL
mmetsp:Transcript_3591/g.3782  ORF Transcript_3591/g.3782 Transcript_3591/m.3782 type:complete len:177 (-) Transcript_3591:100-630(-)